jgi:hypothetical protein
MQFWPSSVCRVEAGVERRICPEWRTESEQAFELSFSPRREIRPVSVFTVCITHALHGDSCMQGFSIAACAKVPREGEG